VTDPVFRLNPTVEPEALCDLRASVGWERLEGDYPAAFERYWATVAAFGPDGRLVGWCALLSDGVRHAVLLDVIVHPDFQRKGIGREIVARALAHARERGVSVIHVDFNPDNTRFYARCGFRIGLGGIHEES
jgi:ribosomal protein S18 acetylase RimI-like enzyme